MGVTRTKVITGKTSIFGNISPNTVKESQAAALQTPRLGAQALPAAQHRPRRRRLNRRWPWGEERSGFQPPGTNGKNQGFLWASKVPQKWVPFGIQQTCMHIIGKGWSVFVKFSPNHLDGRNNVILGYFGVVGDGHGFLRLIRGN